MSNALPRTATSSRDYDRPAHDASGRPEIGDIEFYGYKGIDVAKIRNAPPVHEGDAYTEETKDRVRQSVAGVNGKQPTDVAAICCDEKGDRLLFIGLAGESYKNFAYLPQPSGKARLPDSMIRLYQDLDRELEAAVRRGGDAVQEDDSQGYALLKDPAVRTLQLKVRKWALKHDQELIQTLQSSSAVQHRRVASDALGYAAQSQRQILALTHAARDPDDEVRNNATRALGSWSIPIRNWPMKSHQKPLLTC